MVLTKLLFLFTCYFCSNIQSAEPKLQGNQNEVNIKYSQHDVVDDWTPSKLPGIQDRFHPVNINHMKKVPGKPNQSNQWPSSQIGQPVFFSSNQENFDGTFRNEFSQGQIYQVDEGLESHAGEINPALVNQDSFQTLDFPAPVQDNYITYVQSSTPPTLASTVSAENISNNSLKTVYVPWIFIPPSRGYKSDIEPYRIPKPPEPNYLPPKPAYLPPEPTYLPPEPTYLPPKPTYLPPVYTYPAPPPPPPTYLPPKPGYLPPEPPGYSYPAPPPVSLPPIIDEKEKAAEFTYFFLGRKLWYIPLYFSIYFVLYVGYLVLKAIARHKLKFPHLLHNTSVVSGRDVIQMGLFHSRDFSSLEDMFRAITQAVERGIQHIE